VFVTVKSHGTEAALNSAADHLGNATVISVQNGINQSTLRRYVSADRLLMGMTATVIAIEEPGTVVLQRNGPTILGPAAAEVPEDRVLAAANLLNASGLDTSVHPNIEGVQYNKLVFNTLGVASSLSALDFLGEAITHSAWRNAVGIPLQQESMDVIARAGIQLSRIPGGADAHRFRRLLRTLNRPVVGPVMQVVVRKFFNPRPILFSVQHDLQKGKRTEIEFINGEIVRMAAERGMDAPLNARVVELVHQLEQRGGFFTRDEIISAFREARS
jgi:2-dehydropantoate 2-reductase